MKSPAPSIIDQQIQVIPKKLYFCSTDKIVKDSHSNQRFNIDDKLIYVPFNFDFGPLKISHIYQYINQLVQLMGNPAYEKIKFWHTTSSDYKKYTNSILLICAYQIVVLKKSPQQAFQPFSKYHIPSFRDSSSGKCTYQCTILDCLKGLDRAISLDWFKLESFDLDAYTFYDKLQNGDINEIIKSKVYGFSTPAFQQTDSLGRKQMDINKFGTVLKKIGISIVINLTQVPQLSKCLQKDGIKNYSFPYAQFTTPPQQLIQKFIQVVKNSDKNAKIGVHCKTGLGKVGTMISCYAIKQHKFPANQFIGWIRLCRPGTVVGPQQVFLVQYDKQLNSSNHARINKTSSITQKKRQPTPSRGALARKNSLKIEEDRKKSVKKQNELKKSLDILNLFQSKLSSSSNISQPLSTNLPRNKFKSSLLDEKSSDESQNFNEIEQLKKSLNNSPQRRSSKQQDKANPTSSSQQRNKQGIHTLRTKFKHIVRH